MAGGVKVSFWANDDSFVSEKFGFKFRNLQNDMPYKSATGSRGFILKHGTITDRAGNSTIVMFRIEIWDIPNSAVPTFGNMNYTPRIVQTSETLEALIEYYLLQQQAAAAN